MGGPSLPQTALALLECRAELMVDTEREKWPALQAVNNLLQARYFTADVRWLGAFRIGFGTLLCLDVSRRWWQAREFYTNDGFFPNHFSLFRPMGDELFSLLHAFSTMGEVSAVMAIMLACCIAYTLGIGTKLAQVLAFISITSLDARNIFVENGGDVVVNLLAFLTIPLPLGRRFSIDAVRRSMRARRETSVAALNDRANPAPTVEPVVSLAVLALFLQLAVIYFFNAVHKDGQGWKEGNSIWYFLWQDRIVTRLGIFLREHVSYETTRYFTWGTLIIEFSLPGILLFPFFRTWIVRFAFLLGIGLHGGIALTSRLGPFSYGMLLMFIPLLPPRDFDLIERWFSRDARRRKVIFDVDCGVCLWCARLLKRLDPYQRLEFVGNDETERFPPGVDAELAARTVVVVDPNGRIHTEERAVFEIGRALPFGIVLVGWLGVPGLSFIGRAAYRVFAKNRMAVSQYFGLGACGIAPPNLPEAGEAPPDKDTFRAFRQNSGAFTREAVAAVMVIILGIQVVNDNAYVNRRFRVKRPEWSTHIVNTFRLLEGWGMFAPEPPYEDGRVIIDGRTKDGRKLDPFTGKEPDFDPFTRVGWGHDQFLCDYSNRIRFDWHIPNRQHLRDYLRNWHRYHGKPQDELVAFDVWWVQDKSPKPGQQKGEPLPPQRLTSYGYVKDSGSKPWITPRRHPPFDGQR
jgi:predicted DCC family thiol-disulfide oxidoreductase YuxK